MCRELLRLETRESDDRTAILRLEGRLVGTAARDRLLASVGRLPAGIRRLVLDCSDLEFLDCVGVGALIQLSCAARDEGRQLVLSGANGRVNQLLAKIHCFGPIDRVDTLEAALATRVTAGGLPPLAPS